MPNNRKIRRMSTTSAGLPYGADQDAPSTVRIPLRERPRDWFFIVVFAMFALTSFLIDLASIHRSIDGGSGVDMRKVPSELG